MPASRRRPARSAEQRDRRYPRWLTWCGIALAVIVVLAFLYSYETDEHGAAQLYSARYADIADISIEYATEWMEDSMITVTAIDERIFLLVVCNDQGGDRKFFGSLYDTWKAAVRAVP